MTSLRSTDALPPDPETDAPARDSDVPARLDADAIEAVLRALEERYPTAPLVAVTANGLITEMPESVPRKENPVLKGRAALDGVPVGDHQCLIAAFDRLLKEGSAQCVLHPPGYAEVMWHGFDLRERHGVIVGLIAADDDPAAPAAAEEISRDMVRAGPPRLATMRKDERSFVIGVSDGLTEILGWSADEIVGRRSLEFVHPEDHALAIDNWMEMLAQPGPSRRIRQRAYGTRTVRGSGLRSPTTICWRIRISPASSASWWTSRTRWPRKRSFVRVSSCSTGLPKPFRSA